MGKQPDCYSHVERRTKISQNSRYRGRGTQNNMAMFKWIYESEHIFCNGIDGTVRKEI